MTEHRLKTWPAYFAALADGSKTCEVRRNDRGFRRGDVLVLAEWDPQYTAEIYGPPGFTGRELRFRVGHVLSACPVAPFLGEYVVLSLQPEEGE